VGSHWLATIETVIAARDVCRETIAVVATPAELSEHFPAIAG